MASGSPKISQVVAALPPGTRRRFYQAKALYRFLDNRRVSAEAIGLASKPFRVKSSSSGWVALRWGLRGFKSGQFPEGPWLRPLAAPVLESIGLGIWASAMPDSWPTGSGA